MAFVERASGFAAEITVRRTDSEETVDGKSIMQMLMLAGTCGTEIEITADGADEGEAITALAGLVRAGFGEDD
jgi:phosphocarrier protein HPr